MAVKQNRKIRVIAAGVAVLAALAGGPMAVHELAERGIELPSASSVERLMSMIDARSPGERTTGELAQSKVAAHAAAKATGPRERALGKTFPPQESPMEQLAKAITPTTTPVPVIPPVAPATLAQALVPAPVVGGAGPIGTIIPAAIGGGGGGGGDVPPPPAPPAEITTTVPAVPEPGTWMLMLLGFGMIGSAIRRNASHSLAMKVA